MTDGVSTTTAARNEAAERLTWTYSGRCPDCGHTVSVELPALWEVERLARALIGSDLIPRYHEYAMRVPTMNPAETVEHLAAVWARMVAAEYARLAAQDRSGEPQP